MAKDDKQVLGLSLGIKGRPQMKRVTSGGKRRKKKAEELRQSVARTTKTYSELFPVPSTSISANFGSTQQVSPSLLTTPSESNPDDRMALKKRSPIDHGSVISSVPIKTCVMH
ncbi:hypothetical protein RUM43_000377 [Polyplax serrata]|uniref:Uncharacterized protein n=1 Tax=Polyplax serrata TaxID=468196 RepID=A0AAN8XNY2_POLSC